jgi:hypothetical protein
MQVCVGLVRDSQAIQGELDCMKDCLFSYQNILLENTN